MDNWFESRAYPTGVIDVARMTAAYSDHKQARAGMHKTALHDWEALGPHNIGGRTLALAFNPLNDATLWAGSAGGGLWRSYTAGTGLTAWHRVPTGFPVLGVAAIAINPADSNEIYIGTGEVYNYQKTGNRTAIRTTRGSYGIGILKTTDGGNTWGKALDWAYDELKGVQDIKINPLNHSTVLAATSEGLYRSLDGGLNWNLQESTLMANDILYDPLDTNTVFVTFGNMGTPNGGIYRSTNGGVSFSRVTTGLPATFTGKIMLGVTPDAPVHWYASVADSLAGIGLYRSTDGGSSWTQVNNTDYQRWQGWYSHDVEVSPTNRDWLQCAGVDNWKSTDGGNTLFQVSFWFNWFLNQTVPIGGPEGSFDYCHGDIHRIYFHPNQPNTIYFATDGGIFRSTDGGNSFEGLNAMYQTTQFYADMSNSVTDSNHTVGGLQDNATVMYEGTKAWYKAIGGDGCSAEISRTNSQIVYASYQNLGILRSVDGGQTYSQLPSLPTGSSANTSFVGPYDLCDANSDIVYAGRDIVYYTSDGGNNWFATNGGSPINGNKTLKIRVDPFDCSRAVVSVIPLNGQRSTLWRTTNGGASYANITGSLPDRYYTDIVISENDPDEIWVTLGGFGTTHVYRTTNAGTAWDPVGFMQLPDVPTNNIVIDPMNPSNIYVANDLGVYASSDGGVNWDPFSDALPEAVMAMDLSISPFNRKLRLGTHGNGVYEVDLLGPFIGIPEANATLQPTLYPNPLRDWTVLTFELAHAAWVNLYVTDLQGRKVIDYGNVAYASGRQEKSIYASDLCNGIYTVVLETGGHRETLRILVHH